MKLRPSLILLLSGAFALLAACDENDGPLPKQLDRRGTIVSVQEHQHFNIEQVDSVMQSVNPLIALLLPPRYGATTYIVYYETVSHDGSPTIASGMVVMPDAPSDKSFPMVSYQHGTVLHKTGVPTRGEGEWFLGVILAADGYICSMPDFLGLGYGLGFHPYIHAKSEVTASVDMMRATRELAKQEEIAWNEQLFLIGYSQGGHATMALHRALQTNYADEFTITGSTPMAGPYDASGVQEKVITSHNPYPTPGYLPFIIYSFDMVYDIIEDEPYTMFKPPYDSIIRVNMDQSVSISYLNTVLPAVPREMVKDSIMAAYEADPEHPLKRALRANDLWDWTPRGKMRICYCKGDDQVSYENALVAYDKFMERGADPAEINLIEISETANHSDCALPSMLYAKYFFDSLRVE